MGKLQTLQSLQSLQRMDNKGEDYNKEIDLFIRAFRGYFPIQNFEKMFPSKSSVVISPVISPR